MLMMLPFEAPTIFEGIHKSYFRMPRVVKDQRGKFENDDLFRQLSHEGAVKYTGFKDRPLEERQMKFIANCQEGHTEVSVVQSGNQFTLMFNPTANPAYNNEGCDFDKELGKVHIKAGFILNGVCVLWHGWIDLQRLEGFGCLEFDEYRAYIEEAMLKQQLDKQAVCNNASNPLQSSPIGRLNAPTHPHLSAAAVANQMGPPHLSSAAAAAAAVAVNAMQPPPPSCLGPPPPPSQGAGVPHQHIGLAGPPVSLADSAAHYGNAAIAAAAAAAFHQALGVSPSSAAQGLHGLSAAGGQQLALSAAAAAASAATASSGGSILPGATHLPYTNGTSNGVHSQPAPPQSMNIPVTSASTRNISPLSQNNGMSNTHSNHHSNHARRNSRSPDERERQAIKRVAEDQTHLDDVDVVSDINAHELDFPPRRIFKTSPLTTVHHHRATRRA